MLTSVWVTSTLVFVERTNVGVARHLGSTRLPGGAGEPSILGWQAGLKYVSTGWMHLVT